MKERRIVSKFVPLQKKTTNLSMKSIPKQFIICSAAMTAALCVLLLMFPGADFFRQLFEYLLAGAVSLWVYRRFCPSNAGGLCALGVIWFLMAGYNVLNVWYYTTHAGADAYSPVLIMDAALAWSQLTSLAAGVPSPVSANQQGYGTMLYYLSLGRVAGVDVYMAGSMLATLLSIIFTAITASRIATPEGKSPAVTATTAIILLGSIGLYLTTGCILVKDAFLCLASSALMYVFCCVKRPWVIFAVAVAVMIPASVIRHWFGAFVAVLAVIGMFRVPVRKVVSLAAVVVVAVGIQFYMLHIEVAPRLLHVDETADTFSIYEKDDFRAEVYQSAMGDYENLPVLHKVLRLPVSMAIQFLSPLPWGFTRHIGLGLSYFHNHFSIPWYCVLCLVLYFMFFCIPKNPVEVTKSLVMGGVALSATAYVSGGSVSRYVLPWLPFLIPAAASVIVTFAWRRLSFRWFSAVYALLICAALIVVYLTLQPYYARGCVSF